MYMEMTLPISIASMPWSLHWSMTLATTPTSSLPQLAPSDQAGSYSKDSMRRPLYGPSVISTSFLQATGQAWQVGSLTRTVSRIVSPLSFSAPSKVVVCEFRVPMPPIALTTLVSTFVP